MEVIKNIDDCVNDISATLLKRESALDEAQRIIAELLEDLESLS